MSEGRVVDRLRRGGRPSGASRGRILMLLVTLGAAGCRAGAGEGTGVPAATGDSIVLERQQSYFRLGPAYRVSIDRAGRVHFESRHPRDAGRTGDARIDPAAARTLLERAAALARDSVPTRLMGRAPYCRIVATDHPTVILAWHRGGDASRIEDYLGCHERNDESPDQLIRRLRALEQAIDSVADVARWTPSGG